VYFLAGLYALFGTAQRLPIQLLHGLISAAGAGLAALCADRVWGRRAGWLAGFLFAGLWTSIYFSGELLIVTLATTLDLLLIWLLLGGEQEKREEPPPPRRLFLAGLVWGLSAIARPNVLIFAPVIFWYLLRHRGLSRRSRGWLLLAAGLVLPILPVTAHNVLQGHDAVLISSQGGVNFYIGNNHYSDGRTAYVPGTRPTWQGGFDDVNAQAVREEGRALKPSGVDRHYVKKGLQFWFDEPGAALKLYAHKLRLLLAAGERSNNKNIYFWRERSRVLRWPIWLGWAPVLLLAVLGFYRRDLTAGRRFLLLGTVALYAFSIFLFFVNARYRLPLLAMLTIPAGGGLERILAAVRARHWPDSRGGLVVAAGLLLFSVVPDGLHFAENKIQADPFSWHTLGNTYAAAGKLDEAREAYERALAINRRYQQPYFAWIEESLYTGLGDVLLRQGRLGDALNLYGEWTRERPDNVEARVRLGDLLLQTGHTDEAAAQFEVALRNDPANFGAQLGHAWILLNNGDAGAALRRFESLLRQQPDNMRVLFGSGLCLIHLERLTEAQRIFEQIMQRQPDYWQALGNLAGIYERTGQLQMAYEAYRRLLLLRPQDETARRWLAEHGG
jgi:tetratricopeptide (TPR) repeat protein